MDSVVKWWSSRGSDYRSILRATKQLTVLSMELANRSDSERNLNTCFAHLLMINTANDKFKMFVVESLSW